MQYASVRIHFHGLIELAVFEHYPPDNVNKQWWECIVEAFNNGLSQVQHHETDGLANYQDHLLHDIAPVSTCRPGLDETCPPTNAS